MQLPSGTSFYGTGEVGGPLERTGKRVSLSSLMTLFGRLFLFASTTRSVHLIIFLIDVLMYVCVCRSSCVMQIYSWNTDAWSYNQSTTSLYQSHPWVFSVLPNGQAFGVLADTTRICEVSFWSTSSSNY